MRSVPYLSPVPFDQHPRLSGCLHDKASVTFAGPGNACTAHCQLKQARRVDQTLISGLVSKVRGIQDSEAIRFCRL